MLRRYSITKSMFLPAAFQNEQRLSSTLMRITAVYGYQKKEAMNKVPSAINREAIERSILCLFRSKSGGVAAQMTLNCANLSA